jgi:nucleoredoxin
MDMLTGQKLLRKSGEVILADEALERKKVILYYFSAHWCPPCEAFTPLLADFYQVRND